MLEFIPESHVARPERTLADDVNPRGFSPTAIAPSRAATYTGVGTGGIRSSRCGVGVE